MVNFVKNPLIKLASCLPWLLVNHGANANSEPAIEPSQAESQQSLSFLNHKLPVLHSSKTVDLGALTQNKVVLIVNTASHCGFTRQFSDLEALHQRYKAQGLVVIGFPSDDFFQEEDEQANIANICYVNYGVSFTMVAPVHVWGSNAHPIFKHLAKKSVTPKWNFYKYLISADGQQIQAFHSKVSPTSKRLTNKIESALATLSLRNNG